MVAFTGILVLSQMAVSSFKSFCQGDNDLPGSNLIIVLEEATFLPAFGALWLAGLRDGALIVVALLASRLSTAVIGGLRLRRRGFFRQWRTASTSPSPARYGGTPFVVRSAMSCC